MSLFAMADFHLSKSIKDKPMDVFGKKWENYMQKIEENCNNILNQDDVLLIPGDVSWGTYASEIKSDLEFIENLPGKKIISKGNHDYWWTGAKKLEEMKAEFGITTVSFLHNNFFSYKDIAICGNRGWIKSESEENKKIYAREMIRLELSLKEAENAGFRKKIVMTHYPPCAGNEKIFDDFLELLLKYNVQRCIYGHLHNNFSAAFNGNCADVRFDLVSADYLDFKPLLIID